MGKPGLLHLVEQIAKADFVAAQRLATALDPQREVDVCHVNATIKGHHRFGVSELIFRVQEALKVECGMTSGAPEGGLFTTATGGEEVPLWECACARRSHRSTIRRPFAWVGFSV